MAVATPTPSARSGTAPAAGESPPSTAVLTFFLVGAGLLALGALIHLVTAVQQVAPGWLTLNAATSVGRLRPAGLSLITYGGFGLLATGAAVVLTRRMSRAAPQLDVVARGAGALITLSVVVGTLAVLMGHGTGRPGFELPRPLSIPLAVGLTVVAALVTRQLAVRRDDDLHPAGWFLAAGALAGPMVLLVGTLPRVSGVNDEIVLAFAGSSTVLLWLVSVGLGALHYMVPRTCRTPLHSRQLAVIGFWGWVVFAPLAGAGRLVSGPSQEWLESIGVAATIGLVIPALAIALNIFLTYAHRTSRAQPADLRLALLGTGLFLGWAVLGALTAGRTAADLLGATVHAEGLREFGLLGVAGALLGAAALHAVPDAAGFRSAAPSRGAAATSWLLGGGIAVVVMSLLAAGFVQGALWRAGVGNGVDGVTVGAGWQQVTDAIRPLLWARVVGEALVATGFIALFSQVFSTATSAEPAAGSDG